jgi:hypothetical protein
MMAYRQYSFLVNKKWLSVLLLLVAGLTTKAQDIPLTVIGNVTGVPSELKLPELISVLKGERQRWGSNTKVRIYLMATTTPAGQSTCKRVYNMSGDAVRRYWTLQSLGFKDAPKFCNDVEELERYVSQDAGAIGVIDKASNQTGVKILLIDGKNTF